jgi:hypothetical protein
MTRTVNCFRGPQGEPQQQKRTLTHYTSRFKPLTVKVKSTDMVYGNSTWTEESAFPLGRSSEMHFLAGGRRHPNRTDR